MPELPVFTSRRSLNTSGGNRVDAQSAGEGGRILQGMGKLALSFSEDLMEYEDKWDKAADVNEYTRARNERELGIADLMAKAKADPDHNNAEQYYNELEDLTKSETFFRKQNVKDRHSADTGFDKGMTNIKLRELFRGKMINHQRTEIQKDGAHAKQAYLESGEVMRANVLGTYLDRLKANRDSGFITEDEYQSESEGTKEWEYDRAMNDAGNNPEQLIDSMKTGQDYTSLNKKEKADVMSTARNTIIRHKQIRDMDVLKNQSVNESVFNTSMFEDEDASVASKILLINKMEAEGKVSTSYATVARRYLKSTQDVDAETSAADISKVIRLMNDANVGYEEDFDQIKYLKRIKSIRNDIISTRNLSRRDRLSLQNRLDNSTQRKVAAATQEIGKFKDVKHGHGDIYVKANKFFKDAGLGHLEDEALRQFFYRTEGQEISETQAKEVMQQVAVETVNKTRDSVQTAFDEARETEGANSDLRMIRTKKGGKAIVLYKDGKPVRVVKEIK